MDGVSFSKPVRQWMSWLSHKHAIACYKTCTFKNTASFDVFSKRVLPILLFYSKHEYRY